jgi:hypothetical protein
MSSSLGNGIFVRQRQNKTATCALSSYPSHRVLMYKKYNNINSYKHAKILFVKELTHSIIYDMLQTPEGIERMKRLFKPPKRE